MATEPEDGVEGGKSALQSISKYASASAYNHAHQFFFALGKRPGNEPCKVDLFWRDRNFIHQWDPMEPLVLVTRPGLKGKCILVKFHSMGYLVGLERNGEVVDSATVAIWPVTPEPNLADVYDPFKSVVRWLFDDDAEDALNIPDNIKLHFNSDKPKGGQ